MVDFELFRPDLEAVPGYSDGSQDGRPAYDPVSTWRWPYTAKRPGLAAGGPQRGGLIARGGVLRLDYFACRSNRGILRCCLHCRCKFETSAQEILCTPCVALKSRNDPENKIISKDQYQTCTLFYSYTCFKESHYDIESDPQPSPAP